MKARLKTLEEIRNGESWEPVTALENDYCFITLIPGSCLYWSIGFSRYEQLLTENNPKSALEWSSKFPFGTPHSVIENFLTTT